MTLVNFINGPSGSSAGAQGALLIRSSSINYADGEYQSKSIDRARHPRYCYVSTQGLFALRRLSMRSLTTQCLLCGVFALRLYGQATNGIISGTVNWRLERRSSRRHGASQECRYGRLPLRGDEHSGKIPQSGRPGGRVRCAGHQVRISDSRAAGYRTDRAQRAGGRLLSPGGPNASHGDGRSASLPSGHHVGGAIRRWEPPSWLLVPGEFCNIFNHSDWGNPVRAKRNLLEE